MSIAVAASELKIGVGVVDHEHGELMSALCDLEAAVAADQERGAIGALLERLEGRTMVHFATEEGMMSTSNYPGRGLHGIKHQYLTEQMKSLVARFERGSFNINRHTIVFLRDWLTTHMQKEDLQFGLWLNEHGKR